jgi:hypothetical protein
MIRRVILIILLFTSLAYAGEQVTSYDQSTVPVLNEQLRKLSDAIARPKSLTSSWLTGILPVSKGGTGATAAANAASGVVVLNASSQLPAVDGSLLTGISSFQGFNHGQVFTSSGTWTKPASVTSVFVTALGGGGGGGTGGTYSTSGGGGGAGGFAQADIAVTGNVTVTVGAAGAAGGAGGDSTFVGSTTLTAGGGGAGGTPTAGTGGTTTNADVGFSGEAGYGMYGGNSFYGMGGLPGTTAASPTVGLTGRSYGAGGGGGGGNTGGGAPANGGVGTKGFVVVQWNE